jgi:hypothetical protein
LPVCFLVSVHRAFIWVVSASTLVSRVFQFAVCHPTLVIRTEITTLALCKWHEKFRGICSGRSLQPVFSAIADLVAIVLKVKRDREMVQPFQG